MTCRACHEDRPHSARGLCRRCYERAKVGGTLDQYPPLRSGTALATYHADIALTGGYWAYDPRRGVQTWRRDPEVLGLRAARPTNPAPEKAHA